MKIRKLVDITEMREFRVQRWVKEMREVKVQQWEEVEIACANPKCRYPDAKHYAKGFCQHCYLAERMRVTRLGGDTIDGLQAEFWAVPIGSRLPEGLWDRMKKLGIKNFDTGPKPKPSNDTSDIAE